MLLDPDTQELYVSAAIGMADHVAASARKRVGEMIAGWVAQSGQPLLLADGQALHPLVRRVLKRPEITSAMILPLSVSDQVVGVLNLSRVNSAHPYRPGDLEMLRGVTQRLATIIAAVQQVGEVHQRSRPGSLEHKFLSPRVTQAILQGPVQPGTLGDTRRMSVLVADIRGFTHLVATNPPEAVVQVLQEYFAMLNQIVADHLGIVDDWTGDQAMASFEPLWPEDNEALRAVKAGLDLLTSLNELKAMWLARGLPVFDIGMGINTGLVTTAAIGSPQRLALVTIGQSINVATYSQEKTKDFGVPLIITQNTHAQVNKSFRCQPLGPMTFNGLSEPVLLYGVCDPTSETNA